MPTPFSVSRSHSYRTVKGVLLIQGADFKIRDPPDRANLSLAVNSFQLQNEIKHIQREDPIKM